MASQAIRKAIHHRGLESTKFERLTVAYPPLWPLVERSDQRNQPSDFQSQSRTGSTLRLPLDGDTVKHYPSLGIAALKAEQAAIYRVWLLCRFLDEPGRRWLFSQDMRELLTDKESKLRLFG